MGDSEQGRRRAWVYAGGAPKVSRRRSRGRKMWRKKQDWRCRQSIDRNEKGLANYGEGKGKGGG